ncbi:hypothetical protein [Roseospira visakhapatnamensis]|uniref:Uncharacterized protein n=1 Tax=Roseospira visakhapatnamensis TaxID=390880 RepID=A0A7W6W9Y4_9PROT|nr:hypothetical protein [Roseospira visakhapatnamensis]MBB4266298.1 hypothetical protein [Roseospira visakhapatnamensis]
MTPLLRFDDPTAPASAYDDTGHYPLPEGATSTLTLRYVLDEDGAVIDQYAGLDDAAAVAAHVARQEAARDAARDAAEAPATVMTPPQFLATLFTIAERVAIRAARETDPAVDDFLRLVEDPRLTEVDRADPSTVAIVRYLTTTDPPLLTEARAAQVLAGERPALEP